MGQTTSRRCWDARAVLLSALLGVVAVKGLHHYEVGLGLALVLTLSAQMLGVPWHRFLRRSLWVLPFCLAAAPLMLTVPGPTIFAVPGFPWGLTGPGVDRFLIISMQTVLCFQVMLFANILCDAFDLIRALGRLGCPARLVWILTLCLRYLELLGGELTRLRRARASRAYSEPSLVHRFQTTGRLVGVLFLRTLERAERTDAAMRSRGFQPQEALEFDDGKKWGARDFVLLGGALAGLVAAWVW